MGDRESLSEILIKNLSKTEVFLINGKNEFETWEKDQTKIGKREFYRDLVNMISVSSEDVIDDLDRVKTTINITHLQRMLSYYENNGITDEITLYISKKEGPLLIHDGEIWVALVPLINDMEDKEK